MPESHAEDRSTFVVHLRNSRRRAKAAANAEVCALLWGLDAAPSPGGPLAEVAGITWVTVPTDRAREAATRISGLGYASAVDLVVTPEEAGVDGPLVRWRKRDFVLLRVYEEPDAALREQAPDRRSFLLECGDGVVRRIQGYRGGRGPREHRALAVVDARLLVNLVASPSSGALLDPFGGAGGVAIEAGRRGWQTTTADVDPALRFGLAEVSGAHLIADATALPIGDAAFNAVATEPPYDPAALADVVASLAELSRVISPMGRIAMLAAQSQAEALRSAGGPAGLVLDLDVAINRKGSEVVCLRWRKPTNSQVKANSVGV